MTTETLLEPSATAIDAVPEEPAANSKCEMAVLDQSGDMKINWDPDNADEVAVARKTFDDLKKKGFAAFKITGEDGRGEQVRTFDPQVRRLVMVPQVAGG